MRTFDELIAEMAAAWGDLNEWRGEVADHPLNPYDPDVALAALSTIQDLYVLVPREGVRGR